MQEMWVWSPGWEGPLEKEMATQSSILAWEIPWTEEPGGLQLTGLQRVGHDWECMDMTENEKLSPTTWHPKKSNTWEEVEMIMESQVRVQNLNEEDYLAVTRLTSQHLTGIWQLVLDCA